MHSQIKAYKNAYREPDERFIHDSVAIGFLPDYNVTFKLAISACNAESMSVASMNSLIKTIDAESNQYVSTKITPIDVPQYVQFVGVVWRPIIVKSGLHLNYI